MIVALDPPTGLLRSRAVLLGLAVARGALSAVAVPLAPLLWREHFLLLVLLRPTKEVLLAAGFRVREGDLLLPLVLLATIPLMVLGVWLFFALGRAFADDLKDGDLPGIAGRLLPAERVRSLCRVLDRKGPKVVYLGRLAVFPSSLMAAAAGAAGMEPRRFLVADGLGALTSVLLVLGIGFGLGEAYEAGGPWLTGIGVVAAVALLVALGRWLRSDGQDARGA